jgi:hypothetical protein
MMPSNYIFAPIFMGISHEAVAELLLPGFLPFNLIKYGMNAAITMILYKPVRIALNKSRLLEIPDTNESGSSRKINPGVMIVSLFLIITFIMLILLFRGAI